MNELRIQVGDRVVIARPRSLDRMAEKVERVSFVSAVRPKSFDAGGLCFRLNGKEWNGRHFVRLAASHHGANLHQLPDPEHASPPAADSDSSRLQYTEPSREIFVLAFVLANRPEEEWLSLGLADLRKVAAMLGIVSTPVSILEKREALSMD